MPLVLPAAPNAYSKTNEQTSRDRTVAEDALNLKKNTDISTTSTFGLVLTSPNGTRWRLSVLNTGALVTTSL